MKLISVYRMSRTFKDKNDEHCLPSSVCFIIYRQQLFWSHEHSIVIAYQILQDRNALKRLLIFMEYLILTPHLIFNDHGMCEDQLLDVSSA
jgi:hypothetical protein